jgi:hypothetical protein
MKLGALVILVTASMCFFCAFTRSNVLWQLVER